MRLTIIHAGLLEYEKALALQYELLEKRSLGGIDDTLLLLEHPPVFTLGKRGRQSDILAPAAIIEREGITVVETNRGGETTYHGPGQLVGYLIIDLRNHGDDIRQFVRNLEEVFIRLLAEEYGFTAERNPKHTGVWVGDEKITAIGIAIKHHITMHGFAFNVRPNLNHFSLIVPCGIRDKGVTSLEKLTAGTAGGSERTEVKFETVREQVGRYFRKVYGYE
ncbi:MAG: lipoyl(octanoyl) transferase LipB [Spirochaetales bacterium]|nr:MAG: lipoyl(octanoyl) transferase LipB [Spirochaetales bacterium]